MVIVTRSLLSLHYLTFELVVKFSVVTVVSGHLQAGKERGLELGGGSGSVLFVVCVGRYASHGVCDSVLRQVFFCSGRTMVGGTRAWWR